MVALMCASFLANFRLKPLLAPGSVYGNKSAHTAHKLHLLWIHGVITVYFYCRLTACLVPLRGTAPPPKL